MEHVIIGVDPHKLSATIEVVDEHEKVLGSGRFTTDQAGYTAMHTYAKTWPERVWAVEGANGAGRPLAQRLLENGERVVDVPAKLAARVRLLDRPQPQDRRTRCALDRHRRGPHRGTSGAEVDGELEALRIATSPIVDLIDGERLAELVREQQLGVKLAPSVTESWFDRFD
ncbi:MAG: transposase [Geodermatophilaceae bacterium]|nr:transposase [Geodermatophilaceae bacterium]